MSSTVGNAALLALVAIIPLVVLTLTCFVKLSVVLSLVRNAIGAPDAPSGLVITGLSLVLTFFVMAPVAIEMAREASAASSPQPAPGLVPAPAPGTTPAPAIMPAPTPAVTPAGRAPAPAPERTSAAAPGAAAPNAARPTLDEAIRALVPAQYRADVDTIERALGPLRGFLGKHASQKDRDTFVELAKKLGNDVRGDELWVLAPAFIATELREAFAIAILIFLPFLVIDLIVGLGLASLGLTSTSPQTIALPLKLLLFVAVDGWRLLLDALLRGYV